MSESSDSAFQRAIAAISQSDPIPKLLQEVRVGRKQPDDRALRAVTESWLVTYRDVLTRNTTLDRGALLRLDPLPRLQVLLEMGIIAADHPAVMGLRQVFAERLGNASPGSESQ